MKRSLLSAAAFILALHSLQAQAPLSASQIITSASSQAKKENKNIFIIFHASWCVWCHRMDTAMNDPAVSRYFTDNYVVKHMTVLESKDKKQLENPGAEALMKKYSGESSGIPFWIVLDKNGDYIYDSRARTADDQPGANVGCPASEPEVAHFITILKKSSTIDAEGLEAIRKRFRKIETQ
ncbi:MAG: thioredoxin family protein [Chitinophagaceae bacterium]|nr:MAG: thioredoxin family protein [Chitinophagaceae bacterium]